MKHILLLILSISIAGCCSDFNNSIDGIDCELLADSFVSNDYEYARTTINSICETLSPAPTVDDDLGHELNSKKIVDGLNEVCSEMTVEMNCYACLESIPPQSSFTVTLDSMNISVTRNFRLRVPENDFMQMN